MLTLFIRALIIYLFMFALMRLMGKRQISDMQPFDLVITLLVADIAALPISDPALPLLYGIIPILALYVLHRVVAYASLKNEKIRRFVCGSPLVIIAGGIVREDVMRAANYTLSDLNEQLRMKDVFSISHVEYAILETNGCLSVLLKGPYQQSTNAALELESAKAKPSLMLVTDGKLHPDAVQRAGLDEKGFMSILHGFGYRSERDCLFVSLDAEGMLHAQDKQRLLKKPEAHFYKVERYE